MIGRRKSSASLEEEAVMLSCDRCKKPATVHLTEISGGKPHEIHLCAACAQEAGHVEQSHVPINKLLDQFLKQHAQVGDAQTTSCPDCGMTWQEFKDTGLLGCAKDYELFVNQLGGVVERAQQGANHHTGKHLGATTAERKEDPVKLRKAELGKLRKELARAIEDESYERAARLRDEIKKVEGA
jgi:protein arginine kinase activator